MTCTLAGCGTASNLHLCEQHRFELADLLDNVDFLIVNLDPTIQATKVVKRAGNEGGNGTKSMGSRPPTTDTNQLRYWLWELPRNAYIEARDNPHAGQTLAMARIWVGKARNAVYGPEPATPRDPYETKVRLDNEVPKQLRTKPLLEWLHVTHGITIKPTLIRQWAKRELITRNNAEGYPTYDPATVLIQARKAKS